VPPKEKNERDHNQTQDPAILNEFAATPTQPRMFEVTINGDFRAEIVYRLRAASAEEARRVSENLVSRYYRVTSLPRGSNFYNESGQAISRPECLNSMIRSRCANAEAIEVIGLGTEFPRNQP
jgi:hypothetical protein